MKIKNVIVVNDFNYIQGGASKVAIDTAKLLKNDGLNVIFFSAVIKPEENIEGITYISTHQKEALKEKNRLKGMINGIYNFKVKREFGKLLKKLNREETVIHIHGWTKALSSSIFDIAFKMKFKVILTLHDYFTACPNGAMFNYNTLNTCNINGLSTKCLLCNCDSRNYPFKIYRYIRSFIQNKVVKLPKKLKYAVGISNMSINHLKKYFNDNLKIKVIYNPIDINPKTINLINIEKKDYFLYVGRIDKEKGIENFCKAITDLNLPGIAVGTGKELEKLKEKYTNIDFVGWKNTNEVYSYMKNAEALVVPSIWYESAGLTILEAEKLGTPCIISQYCSEKEFLKKGCSYKTLEDLKKCILKKEYLKENDLQLNKFSPTFYIEELKKFYEED
ncbi:MAG: glycosyltransferase family 4 protein [Clostridia bacterium]|nr:glycosyltransferase family 4 protein [Clostridia bacterium]